MMSPEERREMRRRQVEQCLSTSLSVREWCRLNGVAESTMFSWMARFRKEEPDLFDSPNASQWMEVKRGDLKTQTALAKVDNGDLSALPVSSAKDTTPPAIVVSFAKATVTLPLGCHVQDVEVVLKAVAAL